MAVAEAQARVQTAATTATLSCTLGFATTIGNLLIAVVGTQRTQAQITSVSTALGAYTKVDGVDSGVGSCSIWARVVTGTNEQLTQAAVGSAVAGEMMVYEISGADPAGIAAACASHSANAPASAATAQHTAITPTAGRSGILIAGIQWTAGTTTVQSVDSGMTAHVGSNNRGAQAELLVASAAGSYAPTWSWTTARTSGLALVFVQDAGAAAPVDTTSMFMAWHAAMRG